MPNKFQKSVLERLEQDAAEKNKKSKKLKKELPIEQDTPDSYDNETMKEKAPAIQGEPILMEAGTSEPSINIPTDIGNYLRKEAPRLAKNKTFYLDSDVIEAVKRIARSQGVTDSKLVNDVLRRVLGL